MYGFYYKSNKYLVKLLILCIILIIQIRSQKNCQQKYYNITYYNCLISYKQCSKQYKIDEYQDSKTFKLYQQQFLACYYLKQKLSIPQCKKKCCNIKSGSSSKDKNNFSQKDLRECVSNNNRQQQLQQQKQEQKKLQYQHSIANIATIVATCIPIGLCICCICCACCGIARCSCKGCYQCWFNQCCCCQKDQIKHNEPIQYQVNKYQNWSDVNNVDQFKQKYSQMYCSICLQQNTDCFTKCGHFFHLNCLGEWLLHSNFCPICRSQQYNPLLLICQYCQSRTKSYTIKLGINQRHHANNIHMNDHNDSRVQLGENNIAQMLCDRCQVRQ